VWQGCGAECEGGASVFGYVVFCVLSSFLFVTLFVRYAFCSLRFFIYAAPGGGLSAYISSRQLPITFVMGAVPKTDPIVEVMVKQQGAKFDEVVE